MAENLINLVWDLNLQIQEAQWTPNRKTTLSFILVKLQKSKDKGKILKAVK